MVEGESSSARGACLAAAEAGRCACCACCEVDARPRGAAAVRTAGGVPARLWRVGVPGVLCRGVVGEGWALPLGRHRGLGLAAWEAVEWAGLGAGRGVLLVGRGRALAGRGRGAATEDGRRWLRGSWPGRLTRGSGCTSLPSLVSWRHWCWTEVAGGAAVCCWKGANGSAGSADSQLDVPGAACARRLAMNRLACSLRRSWRLAGWACACRGAGEGRGRATR